MCKGRISTKWREAQALFYASHPDLKAKKYFNGTVWAAKVVEALITMSLDMWASRCKCVYGHTKEEQQMKRKEILKQQLVSCFRQQHQIPVAYHGMFLTKPAEMCERHTAHYLESWIAKFEAIKMNTVRNYCKWFSIRDKVEQIESEGSISTVDREEYWVDTNDGMAIEYMMAKAGQCEVEYLGIINANVRKACHTEEEGEERDHINDVGGEIITRRKTRSDGEGVEDSREVRELIEFGDIELKKRKPPDGGAMCIRHKGNKS